IALRQLLLLLTGAALPPAGEVVTPNLCVSAHRTGAVVALCIGPVPGCSQSRTLRRRRGAFGDRLADIVEGVGSLGPKLVAHGGHWGLAPRWTQPLLSELRARLEMGWDVLPPVVVHGRLHASRLLEH